MKSLSDALASFGDDQPTGFTSRFDSWRFFDALPQLPRTTNVLSRTLDMRLPLTFDQDDCRVIATIIREEIVEALSARIRRFRRAM